MRNGKLIHKKTHMMGSVDANNNEVVLGLEKIAAKLNITHNKKNGAATVVRSKDIDEDMIPKYANIPSGLNMKRHQKSPCTQWPWASKNRSSLPFWEDYKNGNSEGSNNNSDSISFSPKKCIKYPWSHQHKSEALNFSSYEVHNDIDGNIHHYYESQYKTDFALDKPQSNEQLTPRKMNQNSCTTRSLSGTNIRVGKTKNTLELDEHQKRWTSKTLEKYHSPINTKKLEEKEMEDELQLVSQLNIDDALDRLKQKKETAIILKNRKPSGPI